MRMYSLRTYLLMSLFIALSAVLANIKIFSSIAFDSLPAFLGALIISPIAGGIIGALGHFITAFTTGFPFTLPIHLLVMLQMFLLVFLFGWSYKKWGMTLSILLAIIINGPVMAFVTGVFTQLLVGGITAYQFFLMLVFPLTLGGGVNVAIACLVYQGVNRYVRQKN